MPATRARRAGAKPPAEESASAQPAETLTSDPKPPGPDKPPAAEESQQEPDPDLLDAEAARGQDTTRWVPFAGLLAHKPELRDAKLTLEAWEDELEHFLEPGKFAEGEPENTDDGQEA